MTRILTALLLILAALLPGCAAVVVGAAAGTAMVAADRRPPDIMATDERIELQAVSNINDRLKDQVHVNVTSYNKQVLLTGEATTESLKQDAERAGSTELLRAGQLSGVLSQLRDEFDYILLNAPPILPVATMNVLESHCDLHVLVVRANVTSKQAVKQALGSLRAQKPIHVILNGVASNSLPSYMLDYSPGEPSVAV